MYIWRETGRNSGDFVGRVLIIASCIHNTVKLLVAVRLAPSSVTNGTKPDF